MTIAHFREGKNAMNLSERMEAFEQFLLNVQYLDFGQIEDLNDAKNALDELRQFVNSADFLNEFSAICNRFQNGLRAEDLKRKGF